ncbi:MAG: nucleotidyl transferase AbiEii/AbiGii toxin family protein [Blautia sp.]|nr:nucleotidyl transferase AbiEii/AbiGii toxin family protein [Blautia sp.]
MLTKDNFTLEHVLELKKNRTVDSFILERCIYAFGLLEALCRVKMPFIFKGGTSLILLLEQPGRLSTDIDIIVEPGTDVDHYLEEAGKIFPFEKVEQQIRKGKNSIEKRHYKYYYDSPVKGQTPFYISLDILFEENHYSKVIRKAIKNELLITEEPYYEVSLPSVDCILGDKLTAFAPHTTGIPFGVDKELEIIKQMYDIASLTDMTENFEDVTRSYMGTVASEIRYRGLDAKAEDVLRDTLEAAACMASRGQYGEDYDRYLQGIRSIVTHVYDERFSAEKAAVMACKVMHIAVCVLKNIPYEHIKDYSAYIKAYISISRYSKLSKLRKFNAEGFAHVVKAIDILRE